MADTKANFYQLEQSGHGVFIYRAVLKKWIALIVCLNVAALVVILAQRTPAANGRAVSITLEGGPEATPSSDHRSTFTVFEFPAKKSPPRALVFFFSGDGGWDWWEKAVSHAMQDAGYTVIGIDSAQYAIADYDLTTLQSNMGSIVRSELAASGDSHLPVIVGGWSMGAAQAVAVAGGPHPPPQLAGLLLVSPLSRGRYGLRVLDRVDLVPTGPGTFALADFAPNLDRLRIAQWHAEYDHVASRAWLTDLKATHREFDFPNSGHNYNKASPAFLDQFVKSVNWIINPSATPWAFGRNAIKVILAKKTSRLNSG